MAPTRAKERRRRPAKSPMTSEPSLWTTARRAGRANRSMDPANEDAIVALAEQLVADGSTEEALALLARIPETDRTRRVAAGARVGPAPDDDFDEQLVALLPRVKDDDDARQQFIDLLELMGADDPRTAEYRRRLTARLY